MTSPKPPTPQGIKVGDEVRVLKHRNRYSSFPEDGYTGTVTKVARKYATATYTRQRTAWPAGPVEATIEFDMQTGRVRDGNTNYDMYVLTAEQYERNQRRSAAMTVLTARHIELRMGYDRSFTLEQIEALAEVVKTWED